MGIVVIVVLRALQKTSVGAEQCMLARSAFNSEIVLFIFKTLLVCKGEC